MSLEKRDYKRKQPKILRNIKYVSLKVYLKSYKKFRQHFSDVNITDFIEEKLLFKLERRHPKIFHEETSDEIVENWMNERITKYEKDARDEIMVNKKKLKVKRKSYQSLYESAVSFVRDLEAIQRECGSDKDTVRMLLIRAIQGFPKGIELKKSHVRGRKINSFLDLYDKMEQRKFLFRKIENKKKRTKTAEDTIREILKKKKASLRRRDKRRKKRRSRSCSSSTSDSDSTYSSDLSTGQETDSGD